MKQDIDKEVSIYWVDGGMEVGRVRFKGSLGGTEGGRWKRKRLIEDKGTVVIRDKTRDVQVRSEMEAAT